MEFLISVIIFVFGLGVGSFLNVVILRLPEEQTIVRGRSRCFSCARTLAWFELIPLVSFVMLRARCRTCRAPISWQYPLVELATGILFIFVWLDHGQSLVTSYQLLITVRDFFFLSTLVVIFVQDLRWGIILDVVSLPAIAVTLALQFISFPTSAMALDLGLGMLIGGGFFALQYLVSRGRWIGGGDIRLGVLMGAMLGWQLVLVALVLAYIGGALITVVLLLLRLKRMGDSIPFGVFLAPATVIALYYGHAMIQWYFHLAYLL